MSAVDRALARVSAWQAKLEAGESIDWPRESFAVAVDTLQASIEATAERIQRSEEAEPQ